MSGESISEILFDIDRDEQIQFEVLTSGVLAAAVLATAPSGWNGHIIRASAITLSAIAVFHWTVNTARYADTDYYLKRTYLLVEFAGIIVIFHIVHLIVSLAPIGFPLAVSAPAAHLVVTIAIALIAIFIIQFIYQGYLLFWGTVMYVYASSAAQKIENTDNPIKSLTNYALYNFSGQMAFLLLRDNIPDGDSEELEDLRDFVTRIHEVTNNTEGPSMGRLFIGAAIVVVPVFAVLAYLLSIITIPFTEVFLILIATRITKHIIECPALIFGTLSLDDYLQTSFQSMLTLVIYTGTIYWLFFT